MCETVINLVLIFVHIGIYTAAIAMYIAMYVASYLSFSVCSHLVFAVI